MNSVAYDHIVLGNGLLAYVAAVILRLHGANGTRVLLVKDDNYSFGDGLFSDIGEWEKIYLQRLGEIYQIPPLRYIENYLLPANFDLRTGNGDVHFRVGGAPYDNLREFLRKLANFYYQSDPSLIWQILQKDPHCYDQFFNDYLKALIERLFFYNDGIGGNFPFAIGWSAKGAFGFGTGFGEIWFLLQKFAEDYLRNLRLLEKELIIPESSNKHFSPFVSEDAFTCCCSARELIKMIIFHYGWKNMPSVVQTKKSIGSTEDNLQFVELLIWLLKFMGGRYQTKMDVLLRDLSQYLLRLGVEVYSNVTVSRTMTVTALGRRKKLCIVPSGGLPVVSTSRLLVAGGPVTDESIGWTRWWRVDAYGKVGGKLLDLGVISLLQRFNNFIIERCEHTNL
ncbi:MAG: hypothetical protein HQK53_06495 [Oligoflexia bacterium]|nr:hypothetical protein [Oligoflexia bacterium]